eukprot:807668-Amphidinium_carterae.1
MHRANEDFQTLKTGWHNGVVPADVIGATHDASIEVHLLVAPVAVHTARVPRFQGGKRVTTLVLQR